MSSKKLDAAIDALVDVLAELPEHELEGWQRGNRLGLRILCELGRRYPGIVQAPQVGVSRAAACATSGPCPTAPCWLRTVWRPGRVLRGCGQPSNSGSSTFRSSSSRELRSCLASRAFGRACARSRRG